MDESATEVSTTRNGSQWRQLLRDLTAEFESHENQLLTLRHIDQSILLKESLRSVLERAANDIAKALNADHCQIAFRFGRRMQIAYSTDPQWVGVKWALDNIVGEALRGCAVVHISRRSDDLPGPGEPWDSAPFDAAESVLIAPVPTGSLFAVIAVHSSAPNAFDDQAERFIDGAAQQLAVAMRSAQFFDEKPFFEELDTMFFQGMFATGTEAAIFGRIAERLQGLEELEASDTKVQVLLPSSPDALAIVYSSSPADLNFEVPIDKSVSGRAFTSQVMQTVPDVAAEPNYVRFLGDDIRSECAVPVRVGRETIGVFNVESSEVDVFDGYLAYVVERFVRRVSFVIAFSRIRRDMQRQLERLDTDRTLASMGGAAADVIHEVNNTLGAIRFKVLELADESLGPEAAELTETILAQVERAMERPVSFASQIRTKEVFEINQEVEAAVERLQAEFPSLRIDLKLEPTGMRARVANLPTMLDKILTNARDAVSEARGQGRGDDSAFDISVQTQLLSHQGAASELVSILIRDTGIGMDSDTRRHVFDPGFTTKTEGKAPAAKGGLGIGMYLVRAFVIDAGGDIGLGENDDGGTSVHITLPPLTATGAQ